jgi:hypothetical protein
MCAQSRRVGSVAAVSVAFFWTLWSGQVIAAPIGNPVSDFKGGDAFFQIGASNGTRDYTSEGLGDGNFTFTRANAAVGFAVNERSVLGFTGGTLSAKPNYPGAKAADGFEAGAFYRQAVSAEADFRHGFSLQYRYGEVHADIVDVYLYQYYIAYGFSVNTGAANLYGGPLYSSVGATIVLQPSGNSYGASSKSNLGAFGGAEFKATPKVVLGVEFQFMTESAIAAYLQFRF